MEVVLMLSELHKRRSSQNICSSKMANPCGDALASKFDVIITGKSISNFFEKDVNKVNAQPGSTLSMCRDKESQPDNHSRKCQGSQRNYHSKMMKHFDGTTKSNLNEMVSRWSLKLSEIPEVTKVLSFSGEAQSYLQGLIDGFTINDALEVKSIEKVTNHDVKVVEYFLKQKCKSHPEIAKV
ncbi:Adenylosuccinate lyase [Camellia lanceoleosa]|uniref:Adenylosuccinate lyase n=1 Tax=Camellia lanceoleosa TaxID=1840588 RepID=A0ACC0H554_9ERIC|nr:Adenylosuccinate lyase [Camellia lanceoleosa]